MKAEDGDGMKGAEGDCEGGNWGSVLQPPYGLAALLYRTVEGLEE